MEPSGIPGLSDRGLTTLFIALIICIITSYDFYQVGRGRGATISHVVEEWGLEAWWLKWAVGAFMIWLWWHLFVWWPDKN